MSEAESDNDNRQSEEEEVEVEEEVDNNDDDDDGGNDSDENDDDDDDDDNDEQIEDDRKQMMEQDEENKDSDEDDNDDDPNEGEDNDNELPRKKNQDDDNDNDDDSNDNDDADGNNTDSESSADRENSGNDNNDDDDDDDDDDDSNNGLSDYEKLRLERIKRNEERLAKLGLHSKVGGGILGQKPPKPQRKRKSPQHQEPVERRERLSRSTKKDVNYAKDFEFKLSQLPNGGRFPVEKKERTKKSNTAVKSDFQRRVPMFIYQEFQRIKARRKDNLRRAKQASKQAQKALKHWTRQVEIVIKREKLKQEREKIRQEKELQKKLSASRLEKERQMLGGKTRKEILTEIDQRNDELTQLVNSYDRDMTMVASLQSEREKKEMFERKMKIIDSLDRFPKAVNEALSTLNALLVGRSPKDPTPLRRSKRSSDEITPPCQPSSSSNKRIKLSLKKGTTKAENATPSPYGEMDDGGSSAWTIFASTMTADNKSKHKKPAPASSTHTSDNSKKDKQKKIKDTRNVGGWISPLFSKQLDRSWLEREKPLKPIPPPPGVPKPGINKVFDLKSYVPQVGDVVLYYPSAHRDYLKVHPDLLNQKQLKNHLRYPLWIRGKREMNRVSTGSLTLNDLPNMWWTDDWVNDLNDNYGKKKKGPSISDYPIVCRVERVHTEFPHDPYAGQKKVVKTKDSTIINYTDAAIGINSTSRNKRKDAKKAHANLCALLTPLTPILPPGVVATDPYVQEYNSELNDDDDDTDGRATRSNKISATSKFVPSTCGLSIPPRLTAVIAPSSTTSSPFIVPFCWGYAMHHSLTVEESIWTRPSNVSPGGKGKITGFKNSGFKTEEDGDDERTTSASVDLLEDRHVFRIQDKIDEIEELLTRLQSRESLTKAVEEDFASAGVRIEIPVREVCVIVDFLSKLVAERKGLSKSLVGTKDKSTVDAEGKKPVSLADLIMWSLPSRNSISISLDSNHRVTLRTSCWKLCTLEPTELTRSFQDGLLGTLDSVLRDKAEMCIEEFLKNNENANIFVPPITEEAAPSYYLAVPVGMHFARIMARLKANSKGECYYTSIESIQSDLQAITDNCCLYNAPDSEIALLSGAYVQECKRMMSDIVIQHERGSQLGESNNVQANAPKAITNGKRPRIPYNLNAPFAAPIDREWLGRIVPDGTAEVVMKSKYNAKKSLKVHIVVGGKRVCTTVSQIDAVDPLQSWVPQCGDMVLYSPSRHLTFVTNHADSLSPQQQIVQKIGIRPSEKDSNVEAIEEEDDDATNNVGDVNIARISSGQVASEGRDAYDVPSQEEIECSWLEAMVISIRSSFPKKTDEGASSFGTAKPILVIELQLRYSWSKEDTIVVCWRPSPEESFLLPSWIASSVELKIPADVPLSGMSCALPESTLALIGQCFNVLKRRVVEGIAPEMVNPDEVLSNALKGTVSTPPCDGLPSFEDLVVCHADDSKNTKIGRPKKSQGCEAAKERLASLNYLPLWMNSVKKITDKKLADKMRSGDTKRRKDTKRNPKQVKQPPEYEMMLPTPTLSLELIRLRIINGYYRHALAVVSDISESYVTSVLFLLHKHAKRKKDALSIRKIAKFLSSPQGSGRMPKYSRKRKEFGKASSADEKSEGPPEDFTNEEKRFVAQIESIRMLHAVAIACVTDTTEVQPLFFLLPKDVGKLPENEARPIVAPTTTTHNPEEIASIQLIRNLLRAVQRDRADNKSKFTKTGVFKLRIKCDRKVVTENGFVEHLKDGRFMFEPSSTIACVETSEKRDIKVHIMLGDEPIYGARSVNMTATRFILPKGVEGQSFIELDLDDFKENDDFTRAFFTKERRRSTCVRCLSKGNSLFHCRVMKGHTNIDFAFDEHFKDSGGLNKSLLLPWTKKSQHEEDESNSKEAANDVESDSDAEIHEDENNPEYENKTDESWEQRAADARAQSEKSRKAAELAGYLLSQAQLLADEEPRLSQEFIDNNFPKDEDGMYVYCSLCGLSGDVICCESCAIVMHPKCIGFDEIPEDDWYCPRCVSDAKDDGKGQSQNIGKRVPTRRAAADARTTKRGESISLQTDPKVSTREDKGGISTASTKDSTDDTATLLTPANELSANAMIKIIPPSTQQPTLKATPKPEIDDEHFEVKQDELEKLLDELIERTENLEGPDAKKSPKDDRKSQKAKPFPKKRGRPARDPSDNPIENLPMMGRRFCDDVGITSANEFLDTPSNELTQKFIEWRVDVGERPLNGSGPSAYISMFKAQLRQEIEIIKSRRERSSNGKFPKGTGTASVTGEPKQKKRRRSPAEDPWVAVAPDPKIKAALSHVPLSPDEQDNCAEAPSERRSVGSTEDRYLRAIRKGSDDPLRNLPALGRKFLDWVGITNPEEFISTKTSDLAVSFTKYRKVAKMSVLNGSGAAAYCGAWKSQVRKQLELQEKLGIRNKTTDDDSDIKPTRDAKKRKRKTVVVTDVEETAPIEKRAKKGKASPRKKAKFDEKVKNGHVRRNRKGNDDAVADPPKETMSTRGRRRIATDRFGYS